MAGEIQLNGTSLATESSGLITINTTDVELAGYTRNYSEFTTTSKLTRTSTSFGELDTNFTSTISNCRSDSKILININLGVSNSVDSIVYFALYDHTNTQYLGNAGLDGNCGTSVSSPTRSYNVSYSCLYDPPAFSSGSLRIDLYCKNLGGTVYLNNRGSNDGYARFCSNMILSELQV